MVIIIIIIIWHMSIVCVFAGVFKRPHVAQLESGAGWGAARLRLALANRCAAG